MWAGLLDYLGWAANLKCVDLKDTENLGRVPEKPVYPLHLNAAHSRYRKCHSPSIWISTLDDNENI